MSFQRLLKKPREAVRDLDGWVRLQALSTIAREPVDEDKTLFEEFLRNEDPKFAFLAHLGLEKLFPWTPAMKEVWRNLFVETLDLLEKRGSSSFASAYLRGAVLKVMSFVPELDYSVIERVLKSLDSALGYDSSFASPEALLPLLQTRGNLSIQESLGILLASMASNQESYINLLKSELNCQNSDRLLSALISLKLSPNHEFTDRLLFIARNGGKAVADEASRALLACGGKKVPLVMTSLLKEANDLERKLALLPVVASTDKEEVAPLLLSFAKDDNPKVALTALRAIDGFSEIQKKDKLALYAEKVKSQDPNLIALAALLAWRAGSIKSLKIFDQLLDSEDKNCRLAASYISGEIKAEKAVPMLISRFNEENDEKVISQIFLSLRRLLPSLKNLHSVENLVLPWLNYILKSSDPFKRNQGAVLCGCLGPSSETVVFDALKKESHPYVLATLVSALGNCGCKKILLLSKYHDHNDQRVRANMLYAMANCGEEAIPYFFEAINDESPRVRAGAAYNLFILGQLEGIETLNSMLQVPEPLSILSASYAINNIFKIVPSALEADHPLTLALKRLAMERQKNIKIGPGLLNAPEVVEVFNEMALASGDRKKILWLIEERHKRRPSSFLLTRLLAAMYILNGDNEKAFPLMENCIRENSSDLADLLDAYRIVLKLGNLNRANEIGDKAKKLYKMLLDGCIELCRNIQGSGAALMLQRLNFLKEPSVNLYNAMIQLKVLEGDNETVMYLMTELILARPFNVELIKKLASLLPEEFAALKEALSNYANSL